FSRDWSSDVCSSDLQPVMATSSNGLDHDVDGEFYDKADEEIVATIKDLLETRVRPAVAQDGGDITFRGYENGTVYLNMKGACARSEERRVGKEWRGT